MATLSFRKSLLERFPDVNLDHGIFGAVANAFYKSHRRTFPHESVRSLLKALEWPRQYDYIGDHPEGGQPGWSEEVQGVTQDGSAWLFSQNEGGDTPKLWRFPFAHDLDEHVDKPDPGLAIQQAELPLHLSANTHFGDIDCFDGHVYVPLQYESPRTIAVYDAQTLAFVASGHLTNGTGAWCAINPLNGLLYESPFYETEDVVSNLALGVYERRLQGKTLTLTPLGEFELHDKQGGPIVIRRIQGGAFSKNGHLYLVSDSKDSRAGVYGFDMISGRVIFHKKISYAFSWPDLEELEGITICDLDAGQAPHIGGQVHVILLDNDVNNEDDIYFQHYRVSSDDRYRL
jgi:hypothetical protein